MSSLKIIKATPAEAHELARLHGEIFPDDSWTADWFKDQLKQKRSVILLAAVDDGFAGLLVLSVVQEEGEILTLGVRPHLQGRQIGRALLDAAMQEPIDHVFLEVAADNAPALELYRSAGFIENGRRPHYYASGADAILMMKTIA